MKIHELLKLDSNVSKELIKESYIKEIKKCHPDVNPPELKDEMTIKTQELNSAFDQYEKNGDFIPFPPMNDFFNAHMFVMNKIMERMMGKGSGININVNSGKGVKVTIINGQIIVEEIK